VDDDHISKLRTALERYIRELGPDDPKTLWVEFGLGRALLTNHRFAESQEVLSDVLTRQHRVFGESDDRVFKTQRFLATDLFALGEVSDSIQLLRHIDHVASRDCDDDSAPLSDVISDLARNLFFAGEYLEEVLFRRRILESNVRTQGPNHHQTLSARVSLASALWDARMVEDAEEIEKEIVAGYELLADGPWTYVATRSNRAIDHMQHGRRRKGLDEIKAASLFLKTTLSSGDREFLQEIEHLTKQVKRNGKEMPYLSLVR
jgi:hypothetical protein